MSRKKNQKQLFENVEITDIAAEGMAMGKYEGMVVFVPLAIPGDVVDVEGKVKHNRYIEGRVVRYVKKSDKRIEPFCRHFGTCGGCKWQILPYEMQTAWKQKQVIDNLTRIGHLELPEVSPILGSRQTMEYRNKLEFAFSPLRWLAPEQIADADKIEQRSLGYHLPRFFDKVVDIDECRLMPEPINEIRNALKQFAIDNNISFYHQREHTGLLRNVVFRNSNTGGLMVILIVSEDNRQQISLVMDFLHSRFPQITSLMYMVNSKLNDSYTDLPATLYAGDDHIIGEMGGLKFKIGPNSFYQTNTNQAQVLYGVAKDFAALTGREVVYDLYTGTGTIACFVADKAQKVIGIEYVADAIADAKVNAAMNNLTNLDFFAGDMKNVLTDSFIAEHGRPDVIITDPPRSGMHPDVVQVILNANPERIVYVSCNPATQARDLAMMTTQYRIAKVQPVDMFPQTQHVENVVLLTRIEGGKD